MLTDRLARRLEASDSPTVTTLPDGSVDHFCTIVDDTIESMSTRESFAGEILGDRSSIRFRVEAIEPGGQAVNTAAQLHALGADVTCHGYLDAPVFESVPFETVSMGEPADVHVFTFADRDLMLVDDADVAEWTLAELRAVGDLSELLAGDAICCSNWVSIPGLQSAFHQLAEETLPRIPLVFDPGDIVGRGSDEIAALQEAIAALQETFDVVYSANRAEIRTTAEPLSDAFEDDLDRLAAIRAETGITAAVLHAGDEAAAATADGRCSVDAYRIEDPKRHTGGGDRFNGGLAHALACGWEWELALACGNACAAHHVASGTTGDVDDLVSFLEHRQEDGERGAGRSSGG
jgi:sugar/nucleoside kinase (ribokinase family)